MKSSWQRGESALAQKLNRFLPLEPDKLPNLAGLEARRRPIAAHTEIVHERQEGHHAFILQKGWFCALGPPTLADWEGRFWCGDARSDPRAPLGGSRPRRLD